MKRSGRGLSRISISKKLLLCGVLTVVLACLLVSVFLIGNTARLLEENMLSRTSREIEAITDSFAGSLTRQEILLTKVSEFAPLIGFLNASHASDYGLYEDYYSTIDQWVRWLRTSEPEFEIKFYMDSDFRSISSMTNGKLAQLDRSGWYSPEDRSSTCVTFAHLLVSVNADISYADAIVYYRNIRDATGQSLRRAVTVTQTAEQLRSEIHTDTSEYFLVDARGIIVCSNLPETQGQAVSTLFPFLDTLEESAVLQQNGLQYYIRRIDFHPPQAGLPEGWQILYRQDYSENIREIRRQISIGAAICAVIVLAAIGFALIISANITSRLKLLLGKIGRLAKGDFSRTTAISGTDEIASISASFDEMASRLDALMTQQEQTYQHLLDHQRRENELMMNWRDSEYQVLRAQINPHYLFNTLESIRMSLLLGNGREAVRIMHTFAESMREYMDIGKMYAPLKEELQLIGSYAEILRFRMGERFRWEQDVPEEAMELEIPRLILQPLVENAVSHGIDKKVEGGRVRLTVRATEDWLVCQVSDDGVGMDAETLRRTMETIAMDTKAPVHLGLWNINHRLMLLYGPEHGLRIESNPGEGTTITVSFRINGETPETEE